MTKKTEGPPPVKEEAPKVSKTSKTVTTASKTSKPLTGMFRKIETPNICPKLVIAAVEGWGKTTMATQAKGVGLMATDIERGYEQLLAAGRVQSVPYAVTSNWNETLDGLREMKSSSMEVFALDELTGFQKQCFEYVKSTVKEYKNDWARFWNYHNGAKLASETEWLKFLLLLQELKRPIIALSHCEIEKFEHVEGKDFSRYSSALHKYIWAATRRWADSCYFGTFLSVIDKDGKGVGLADRVLYTERRDTHDAKDKYGLDPIVMMPPQRELAWGHIWNLIKEGGK